MRRSVTEGLPENRYAGHVQTIALLECERGGCAVFGLVATRRTACGAPGAGLTGRGAFSTLPSMTMLLIRRAEVFAPEPLGLQDLLIGGGRVLGMGAELPALPSAIPHEVLDLEGARLIPGLIDAHVHVTGGGGEAGFASRVPPVPLSRFTAAGITTVVGLLGTDDVARGPRELLASVYALRELGLNAYAWTGGYHLPPATLTGSVRGDLVFIDAMLGIGEIAISDHRSSQPTFEELVRLASDAHVAGLMTHKAGVLHLHLGDGERGLELVRRALDDTELPARVFHPTHVNRRRALFEEAVALALRGACIDVTAFPVDEDEDAWSATEAVERYFASAAPTDRITVSSDAGGCLPCFDADGRVSHMDVGTPGALLATINELTARGMPLGQALLPFTANVAALLRLPGKGRIVPGADADLVALDASGVARETIIAGVRHVADGSIRRRGMFESTSNEN
jgi:beta-aspartyl-dipeptidase (metallo-type)